MEQQFSSSSSKLRPKTLQRSLHKPNSKTMQSSSSQTAYNLLWQHSPSLVLNTANSIEGGPVPSSIYDKEPTREHLIRHSDLWFEDGSVICRAENTLYRVHISQLARHSSFFKDMFALPQPESIHSETPESSVDETSTLHDPRGIPRIYLHDTAEDVGNLLTALYDGPNFLNNNYEDFRVVSGILRLSTKYAIDSLRAKALTHLSIAWPSTLKAWDTREDLARGHEIKGSSTTQLYPHPLSVITLAREVDAPSLLPAAFYDLSRYSFAQIFEPSKDDPMHRQLISPPHLSAQDIQRLCLGKEASQHAITTMIQAMGSGHYVRHAQQHNPHTHMRKTSSGAVCMSAAACRKDFSELVDLATQHYMFDRERGYCDPLYVAEELGQLKSAEFSECKACAVALEAWAAREREKIWKQIPSWFRLDGGDQSPDR